MSGAARLLVRGAVVVLAVDDPDRSEDEIDDCLSRLVAAADDAAATGVPVVLAAAVPTAGGRCAALLEQWADLASTLDAVTVRVVAAPPEGARRAAATAALADHTVRDLDPRRVVVLTTDTGSTVGRDWVLGHLGHLGGEVAASTAAVVPGTRGVEEARQVHAVGSNLAVRGDAYLAAGGFPARDTGEVELLWERLREKGFGVCHAFTPLVTCRAYRPVRAPG